MASFFACDNLFSISFSSFARFLSPPPWHPSSLATTCSPFPSPPSRVSALVLCVLSFLFASDLPLSSSPQTLPVLSSTHPVLARNASCAPRFPSQTRPECSPQLTARALLALSEFVLSRIA